MNQLEAWIVTALGMSVVFAGLVLCIIAINAFNHLAKHVKFEGAHAQSAPAHPKAETHAHESVSATGAAPAAPMAITPEPSPEVLAVIATALEIERRLYLGRQGQRLTLNRN